MDYPFEPTWNRVKTITGWDKYMNLANFLGIHPSSVNGAKRRGTFPSDWAVQISLSFNVNAAWLLTGEGPIYLGEQVDLQAKPKPVPVTAAETIEYDEDDEEELTLDEFWQAFFNVVADPAWRGWYRIELIKRFPELTERIKKQREVDRKDELARTKVVGE